MKFILQTCDLDLDKGILDNEVYSIQVNALWISVRNHHVECVQLLLEHGADPNCLFGEQSFWGDQRKTPLQVAVYKGCQVNNEATIKYCQLGTHSCQMKVFRLILCLKVIEIVDLSKSSPIN